MTEEFVRGIARAVKMRFLTKDEGSMAIRNMIVAERNSERLDLMPLIKRIENIEGFLNL